MPETETDLANQLRAAYNTCHAAYVESVGGYVGGPGQPGSAMFKFGRNFGFILGCLATLQIPVLLVRPQQWQKALGLGHRDKSMSKHEWKTKLKAEAQRRYPHLKVTLETADALLILSYAMQREREEIC